MNNIDTFHISFQKELASMKAEITFTLSDDMKQSFIQELTSERYFQDEPVTTQKLPVEKATEEKPEVTTTPISLDNSFSPSIEVSSVDTQKTNETNTSPYNSIIQKMADKYSIPSQLITSVIQAESSFNPQAISPSGAQGLMQLMPKTAAWLGVNDSLDPAQNIEGGTKYLSKMMDRYDGNVKLALAAYNAGPGNVDKYGGVPPFAETENYIKKILS